MLGVIASLSAQVAVFLSQSQTSTPANAYVYTNGTGLKVEVLGACKIDEGEVVAWDVTGAKSASLRQRIVDEQNENGGSILRFALGTKTRYVILSVVEPLNNELRIWNADEPAQTSAVYKYSLKTKDKLSLFPVVASPNSVSSSIGVEAPSDRRLLATLKPRSGLSQESSIGTVSLDRVEKYGPLSVMDWLFIEGKVLAINNKAWSMFFTMPAIERGDSIQFELKTKEGRPLYVDFNGKPTKDLPDRKKLNQAYYSNKEPDPNDFPDSVRSHVCRASHTKWVLVTNVNPKFLDEIKVYQIVVASTAFNDIPLDPKVN